MSSSYFNPSSQINFSRTIERLVEDFTGREWLFEKLDNWLNQEDGEKFYLLTGEPGVGKSAIAAELTKRWKQTNIVDLVAYHFCRAGDIETVRPGRVLRSLATQLGKTLPHYGEALNAVLEPVHLRVTVEINIKRLSNSQVTGIYVENLKDLDPKEEFRLLIQEPLTKLSNIYANKGEEPPTLKVFLIDSLDEAVATTGNENMATLLASLYQASDTLPSWVRFLLTARPDRDRVLSQFDPLRPQKIEEMEEDNLSDIQKYIEFRVDNQLQNPPSTSELSNDLQITKLKTLQQRLEEAELTVEDLVQTIKDLSHGNFLYTKLLINSIASGEQSIQNLSALPQDLNDIYHRILRYRCSFRGWLKHYQPILGRLSVTQEPISQKQLAKFVGIEATELEKNLDIFKQFLDEEKEQGETVYSIFHQSLREYLLDKKNNHDFWCEESEEHDNIVNYFERKSQSWQNFKEIESYGLRHLAQHLVKANQVEKLHTLLRSEKDGRNAWFDAKDISSYQADIRIAWEQVSNATLSSENISRQFHYTLITASLNSIATRIPDELLVAAVQYGQWSPDKGISYALQIPDPLQKVKILVKLLPFLPTQLKTESLQSVIDIISERQDEEYLIKTLEKLIPETTSHKNFLPQILDLILKITNKDGLRKTLSTLAPYLEPELLCEALTIFYDTKPYRIEHLTALIPQFDRANLWLTAFDSIPNIQDDKARGDALLELAKGFPNHLIEDTLWTSIFNSILSIDNGETRSRILATLASTIPEKHLEQSLEIALTAWYWNESHQDIEPKFSPQALEAIAPRLSSELLNKAIDLKFISELKDNYLSFLEKSWLKRQALLFSSEDQAEFQKEFPDVLSTLTHELPQNTYTQVVCILAPHLSNTLLSQVLHTLQQNYRGERLANTLTKLVPHFPEALEPAYEAAQTISSDTPAPCAFALINLLPDLPHIAPEVLEIGLKIKEPYLCAIVSAELIPYLPEAYSHALQAAIKIEDEFMRLGMLNIMPASYIYRECVPLIIELSQSFTKDEKWQDIQSIRAEILIHFLPHLPELFPIVWETVMNIRGGNRFSGGIRDEDIRVQTTRKFVSAIPKKLIPQALDKTIDIYNELLDKKLDNLNKGQGSEKDFEQAFMLEMLAPRITPHLLPKAIKAACAIIKFERRDPVLSALASTLPEHFPLELEVVKIWESPFSDEDKHERESRLRANANDNRISSVFWLSSAFESTDDYLKAMIALAPFFPEVIYTSPSSRIRDDSTKAALIKSVAQYLSEEYLLKGIQAISEVDLMSYKVGALLEIAKYLSPDNRYKILDILQSITYESDRSKAFVQLIPFLSENKKLLKKIFDDVMCMEDDDYRLSVLVALVAYVDEALPRALDVSSSIKDYYDHSQSLLELTKYLPDDSSRKLVEDSLSLALKIPSEEFSRCSALIDLAPFSESAASHALDAAISYRYFDVCYFENPIKHLAPYLANNKKALIKAFEAARSLDDTLGYKYEALMALSPYLPEALSETKDAIIDSRYSCRPYYSSYSTLYLVRLVPHFPKIIFHALDAVLANSQSTSDYNVIEQLEKLIPYVNAENISEALSRTKSYKSHFALKVLLKRLSLTHPIVFRKLASKYTSKSISFPMSIFQNRSWIRFLEKTGVWQKGDSDIYFQVQEILESLKGDNEEITWYYVYALTGLNPNIENSLIERGIEKPFLWDFPRKLIEDFIKGIAPDLSQEFIGKLLEDDPSISEKAVSADYAIRQRLLATVFLAPYLSPKLFEKALNVSILVDDYDRAKILKVLIPKLPETQLPMAKKILESIESTKERTELLLLYAVRCPDLLIEVLQAVFSLSLRNGRTERLNDLIPYLQQIPTTNLFSFWTKSLEFLFPRSRAEIFEKVDVLAPVAHHLGGDEAIEGLRDSIDCVTRWWR